MKIDTKEKVHELFEYRNGSLYWKIRPSPAANIGDRAGCVDKRGFVKITYRRVGYMESRLVMIMHGVATGKTVVHINGNNTDNRIENLKPVDIYETIDHSTLVSLFNFESNTGHLTYRHNTRNKHSGEVVGKPNSEGYLQTKIGKKIYKVHRLIWMYVYGKWPSELIDHINGNRSDNRVCNLREASNTQNLMNSKVQTRNVAGEKGVTWRARDNRWIAACKANGKQNYIGSFVNVGEAILAVRKFRVEHHGEFARNN